jgi:sarcosine oxidase subunit beta
MGGVRAQFATPVNIRMSLYSIAFFRDFEPITGHPSGYRPQGYLFVASQPRHLEALRANIVRQAAHGLREVSLLSRDDVVSMVPQLRSDDILGGSFCPTDGFVDPHSVMTGFTEGALRQGARLLRDRGVTAIEHGSAGDFAVRTRNETLMTPTLVNAAGPWAAEVAALAGIDLPVVPLRRMLLPTEPFEGISRDAPMTVDMATGFHFRPEGLGFLMAWNDPDETPGFKTAFDRGFVEKILARAVDRVPVFASAQVNPSRGWAGLYEMTPDHHPILGGVPEPPGLYLANGFSGHGVMHSPATGKILAELILHGRTQLIDANVLDYNRFGEGRTVEETAVL